VGLKSLKSLNLTNGYPNKNKNKNKNNNNKNNKVKSKPLELFELAGKNPLFFREKGIFREKTLNTVCRLNSLKFEKNTNALPGIVSRLFFRKKPNRNRQKTTSFALFCKHYLATQLCCVSSSNLLKSYF
jgi:hypothetical protein